MEKDPDPCQFHNIGCASTVKPPPALNIKSTTNSKLLPNYADIYGMFKFSQQFTPSNFYPTAVFPMGHKRLLIFDQSKDQCTTHFLNPIPWSDETNVSNVHLHEEEMHEDTEEIDALLYSDSDNEYDEEEEEEEVASTGHSPIENAIENSNVDNKVVEEVLQTPVALHCKRRRVEYEIDTALEDTASSTNCNSSTTESRKKVKCEKIQETVGVLRRIIPGGKGKDAASVLDEAIKYLKSLRLKAKGLEVGTLE